MPSTGSKVARVTLAFWVIKIAATTLGETGGDTLSMSFNLGYALSTGIFFVIFVVAVAAQIRAQAFHPALYWATIVATTLTGTTIADFCDRSLGIGYIGGSSLLFGLLVLSLLAWRLAAGSVAVDHISSAKAEAFYWLTILTSNTLGTALGDLASNTLGLGFAGGVLLFSGLILVIGLLYLATPLSRILLFWAAFVLTRPFGATAGDLLTKPHAMGGFAVSRPMASAAIALFMAACVVITTRRDRAL